MSMTRNYHELIDDLRMFPDRALMMRAASAIEELLVANECLQSEVVLRRRQIEAMEMKEEEKLADLREGNRSPYRRAP